MKPWLEHTYSLQPRNHEAGMIGDGAETVNSFALAVAAKSPFAAPPTVIEVGVSELRKSVWQGVGMAIGLAIGGAIWFLVIGKRV